MWGKRDKQINICQIMASIKKKKTGRVKRQRAD
jgi:hypothetical protein